jgi:mycothiol synthase
MRRPNLDGLPSLDLPPGYTLRTYRDEDLEPLAALLQSAFPEMTWDAEKVRGALPGDETVKTTFLIEHGGVPVATASARLVPEQHPGSGYVHWVGAHPEHRGARLGYFATVATLHEFVRLGCRDAVLETDDQRIPALRTYLRLGFAPEMRHDSHTARWARLAADLEDVR